MERPRFAALVPVKSPAVGKSRLRGVTDPERARLAAGFALDTVAACLATPSVARVLAVTEDAPFASRLTELGCAVARDGAVGDLNESLRLAARVATGRWPDLVPVAVCADLPALSPGDLETVLGSWSGEPAFVADAEGSGSTLYVAATDDFRPLFGADSRAAHRADGATEVTVPVPTLRRDVDDLASLQQARGLGLGPHTAAVVAGIAGLRTH